ncbi:site-specific tyrosine recombinase XerD [compost metagenome]
MLYLAYASGLRVSEVVRQRLNDFDRERGMLRIRQGKGKKDRHTFYSMLRGSLSSNTLRWSSRHVGFFPASTQCTNAHCKRCSQMH